MEPRSLNEVFWSANKRCFGCGVENDMGLHLRMYEHDGGVVARWQPRSEYENWSGVIHGGLLTAALDELGGAAAWLAFLRRDGEGPSMVTAELTVRFRTPARTGQTFDSTARVTELGNHHALAEGSLVAGETLVSVMSARYVKLDNVLG